MATAAYHHHKMNVLFFLFTMGSLFSVSDSRRYRLCSEGCCIHEYCAYHTICYPKIHCRFGCPDGYCAGKAKGGLPASTDTQSNRMSPSKVMAKSRDSGNTGLSFAAASKVYDNTEAGDGICMPLTPCKPNDRCGMGHSCSFNFNLGYSVCQYNLEIGTTLCFDTSGHLKLTPTV